MTEDKAHRLRETLGKNKAIVLLLALGAALMLLSGSLGGIERGEAAGEASFDEDERKLAVVLSGMEGTGRAAVLLREDGRGVYSGAVVVCDGAQSAQTRLKIISAVSAFTGLGSDKIIVLKMQSSGG